MSAAQYPQEKRDEALGMLMASAVLLPGGDWQPDFRATERASGISRTTLLRWWRARDRDRDVLLRAGVARAPDIAAADGASSWYRSLWSKIQTACDTALDPAWWEPVTVPGPNGRPVTVSPRARSSDIVRAAQMASELSRPIAQALGLLEESDRAASLEGDRARLEQLRGKAIARLERIVEAGKDSDAEKAATTILDRSGVPGGSEVTHSLEMETLREWLSGEPEKAWGEDGAAPAPDSEPG